MKLIVNFYNTCTLLIKIQCKCFLLCFLLRYQHVLLDKVDLFTANQVTCKIILVKNIEGEDQPFINITQLKFDSLVPYAVLACIVSNWCHFDFALKLQLNVRVHFSNQLCISCKFDLNAANYKFADNMIKGND